MSASGQSSSAQPARPDVHVISKPAERVSDTENTPLPTESDKLRSNVSMSGRVHVNSGSSGDLPNTNNKHSFSFLLWNVNGLFTKIRDRDFVSFIRSFDFVCLVETFMDNLDSNMFSGYKIFYKPAVKLSKQGRRSGGVMCMIKNTFLPFVKSIDVQYTNFCVFLVDKLLFGTPKDVLYVCVYLPPEGSPFYAFFDVDKGVSLLEECLTDIVLKNYAYIILCGDLNSRTSNISQDSFEHFIPDTQFRSNSFTDNRSSQDKCLNNYGKELLNMCTTLSLSILNGVCNGDRDGCYTYISDTGSSVTDYFIFSNELLSIVYDTCELNVCERIESDHMPITLSTVFPNKNIYDVATVVGNQVAEKFVWNSEKSCLFNDSLYTESIRKKIDNAIDLIDVDVNTALDTFNECMKECAECMKKCFPINNNKRCDGWFDHECFVSRTHVRRLLRQYKQSLDVNVRHDFLKTRREYKKLLKRKEKDFNDALLYKLTTSIQNQKEFWNCIHKVSFKRKQPKNDIDIDTWFRHFKSLLDKDTIDDNVNVQPT
jgi:hypothetical protein